MNSNVNQLVRSGDSFLAAAAFDSASEAYRNAIFEVSSIIVFPENDKEVDRQLIQIGKLMYRVGLALLGGGRYSDAIAAFCQSTVYSYERVGGLCMMASVLATCDDRSIYNPGLAHLYSNAALFESIDPLQQSHCRLVRGLVLTALGRFQEAQACMLEIPPNDQIRLEDFPVYFMAAASYTPIRRSQAEYAYRCQKVGMCFVDETLQTDLD